MKLVKLSDVCEIIAGQSPPSSTYNRDGNGLPFFQGKADFGKQYPTVRTWCSEPRKIAEIGDILISVRAPVGPTNINNIKACIGRGLSAIRAGELIDRDFLLFYLRSIEKEIASLGKGSTFKAITQKDLQELHVPLPPIEIQRKLLREFKLADNLIQKRKNVLVLVDEYIKSVFIEMFGDQASNTKKWKIKTLQDLTTKLGDGLHGTPIYDESGDYFFINGNNLEDGKIIIKKSTKRVSQEEFEKYKKPLNENSVLVSINGTLGRVAFYQGEKIILGKSACYFNIKQEEIDPFYLYFILKSDYFVKYASGNSTGSTIQNVSLKTMRNFPLMLPPLQIQKQFAEIVQKVESVKQKMFLQSQEFDNQFQSLMQKSFSNN